MSPHLDDAILSCFAIVARPRPVEVVNVFSGEPQLPRAGAWDEVCGFADSAKATATRRMEDAAAFNGLHSKVTNLDLLDLQYLDGPRSSADLDAIEALVRTWAARNPRGVVAAPAGAGRWPSRLSGLISRIRRVDGDENGHPDHRVVRDAAVHAVARSTQLLVLLYEELPYTTVATARRDVRRLAEFTGLTANPIDVPIDREHKAARIAAYASQVPYLHPTLRLDRPSMLPSSERYWALLPRAGGADALAEYALSART